MGNLRRVKKWWGNISKKTSRDMREYPAHNKDYHFSFASSNLKLLRSCTQILSLKALNLECQTALQFICSFRVKRKLETTPKKASAFAYWDIIEVELTEGVKCSSKSFVCHPPCYQKDGIIKLNKTQIITEFFFFFFVILTSKLNATTNCRLRRKDEKKEPK